MGKKIILIMITSVELTPLSDSRPDDFLNQEQSVE